VGVATDANDVAIAAAVLSVLSMLSDTEDVVVAAAVLSVLLLDDRITVGSH